MLYAVIGPAQVGVGDLDAVPEVELDAGPRRLSLQTGGEWKKSNKKRKLFCHLGSGQDTWVVRAAGAEVLGSETSGKLCHKHFVREYERKETEIQA